MAGTERRLPVLPCVFHRSQALDAWLRHRDSFAWLRHRHLFALHRSCVRAPPRAGADFGQRDVAVLPPIPEFHPRIQQIHVAPARLLPALDERMAGSELRLPEHGMAVGDHAIHGTRERARARTTQRANANAVESEPERARNGAFAGLDRGFPCAAFSRGHASPSLSWTISLGWR